MVLADGGVGSFVKTFEAFFRDLRFSARALLRTPGFAAVATLTLAVGIGAATAIFAVVDAVFFAPLGLAGEARLVRLRDYLTAPDGRRELSNTSGRSFEALRERNRVFEMIVAWNAESRTIPDRSGEGPERISLVGVSEALSRSVGVRPIVGRDFTEAEERAGREARVALVSDSLARRRFGGEAEALGAVLPLDGVPHTIVGVLPAGFRFPYDAEAWVPERIQPSDEPAVFARLKPGRSLPAARRDLERIAAEMKADDRSLARGFGMEATPARESLIEDEERIAVALLAVVGFFFLLACADVANLLLARSLARWREAAIRAALGASRSREIANAFADAVALVLPGAAAGILLSIWIAPLLASLIPDNLRRQLGVAAGRPDVRILAFAIALAFVAAAVCAIAPAVRRSSRSVERMLREAGRSADGGRGRNRLLSVLVAVELAFSLVLLLGAGSFVAHLNRLNRRPLGFEPRGLWTFRVALPPRDGTAALRNGAVAGILRAIDGIPGVVSAGVTTVNPLAFGTWVTAIDANGVVPSETGSSFLANFRIVSAGFFRTAGVPVVAGRDFDGRDAERAPGVAIVSRALARRLWPGGDPIGKRLRLARAPQDAPWRLVVGVVGDVADAGDVRETWYLPYDQASGSPAASDIHVFVRARGESTEVVRSVRVAIASVDPDLAPFGVETLEEIRRETLARERFGARLAAAAALLGVLVAALGVAGLGSYRIEQRRGEIAIRLAMGARPSRLVAQVLIEGSGVVLAGLAAGVAGAFVLDRILESLLPALSPPPWGVLAGLAALLGAVAVLALAWPALRGARRDPMEVLRS